MRLIFATAAATLLASAANATIIQADFRSELNLPAFFAGVERVLERTAQTVPNAGFELDESDEISNPSGWADSLQVDFNPLTNILSLTGTGPNDYQIIDVWMSNILFDDANVITGFAPISTGNAVFGSPGDPAPILSTSFTATSLMVSYVAPDIQASDLFGIDSFTDTYQVILGPQGGPGPAPVPLPAALPLFAFALGALGVAAKRRKR